MECLISRSRSDEQYTDKDKLLDGSVELYKEEKGVTAKSRKVKAADAKREEEDKDFGAKLVRDATLFLKDKTAKGGQSKIALATNTFTAFCGKYHLTEHKLALDNC